MMIALADVANLDQASVSSQDAETHRIRAFIAGRKLRATSARIPCVAARSYARIRGRCTACRAFAGVRVAQRHPRWIRPFFPRKWVCGLEIGARHLAV